ncbi:hypothetical protein Xbed_01786 [Xenorhabdus beddingii]|uniref:Protein YciN n=1 Tax=Xenorhabdus beddingii TaxID=40578 RepID=A0A1Y2SN42_9GAMM|nr:YciN family protein [Xenorhabdus beddingii]OTA20070.1 hypothetical protein Xbed_01786 [Xenorhabdus beddingii]
MPTETLPIKREQLLKKANEIIKKHEDFIQGMHVGGVEQKNGIFVFQGEYFLDEFGLPTAKSTAVFNMFKHLAHVLSEKYHLVD